MANYAFFSKEDADEVLSNGNWVSQTAYVAEHADKGFDMVNNVDSEPVLCVMGVTDEPAALRMRDSSLAEYDSPATEFVSVPASNPFRPHA